MSLSKLNNEYEVVKSTAARDGIWIQNYVI